MYVNNSNYSVNLKMYHSLRDYMIFNIYPREEMIKEIISLIESKIDCLGISFDTMRYEINISIKKTTMRRAKGYKASSMYYYGVMNSVFKDFFTNHPEIINKVNMYVQDNINNFNAFNNICQIVCIGDRSVTVKL